jgi:ADP-ribose pyrophosphatase YjhB (NUDIX family)
MDKRFDFPSVVALKIIVRKGNKYFIIKEPDDYEWKPGCYSLPGGKLFLNESIPDCLNRKIKSDIDFNVKIKGLIKIIDMLLKDKKVYHFIFLADYVDGIINVPKIEAQDAKWLSAEEIREISKNKLAEYYIDDVISEIDKNKMSFLPSGQIKVQDFKKSNLAMWFKL